MITVGIAFFLSCDVAQTNTISSLFGGLLAYDGLTAFIGFFTLATIFLISILSYQSTEIQDDRFADYKDRTLWQRS